MELKELWRVIKKRLAMIVVITLVATITSGVVSKVVLPKQYAGTATLMVIPHNNAQDLLTSMVTGQQLVDTYSQLVTSPSVVNHVNASLHLGETERQLTHAITATPETNTDLLTVTVKGKSPTGSAKVANAVANQTVALVTKVQGQKNLEVVTPAAPSSIPVAPKAKTNVAIAFVLGLLVSGGLAFLLEYLDDSVHSEDDVKRYFGDWPLLTVIPAIEAAAKPLGSNKARAQTTAKRESSRRRGNASSRRTERG